MAKVVNGLGRALPNTSEVKGRVLFGPGWHWSRQQSKPMAESDPASRADVAFGANGSGSVAREPATSCAKAIARNASAHEAQ